MKRAADFYGKNFKKLILLQVVLCIVWMIFLNCFLRSEKEIKFDESNISGGNISKEGYACIDESDGIYGIVLDTTTGEVKKGWYKVRIEYETGYDDNGFIVQALRPGNVLNEDIGNEERAVSLKGYHNSREVHAWLKEDSDLRIAVHFCGGGYLQIKRIILRQIPNYTPLFLIILCLLFLNTELYEISHLSAKEIKRRRLIRGGIACMVFLASIPLMNDFNIHGHDYKYHLYCMEGVAEGLISGQFPVKIMPNWWNEFGDGAPMFYGDILLYIPALITLLGYSLQTAYKCYIVFINLLTAGIAYKCFWEITKDDKIALLGAFLYTLNLYRLIDIYVRCAVGEYTALTFLPLILLGVYLMEENGWIYMAAGLTGCIQSHILVCVMIGFFFILFCIIKIKWVLKKKVFLNFCRTGILTLLWNLWYIVPFLELYMTKGYKIHSYETEWLLEERGIPFSKIFNLYFDGMKEEFFVMGLPLLIGLVLSIIFYFIYRKRAQGKGENRKWGVLLGISGVLAVLAIFLSMNFIPYSRIGSIHPVIDRLVNLFEFPFRFMCIATLLSASAVISACILWRTNPLSGKEKKTKIVGYATVSGLVMLALAGTLLSYWKLLTGDFPYVKNYEYYAIDYIMDMDKWLPLGANQGDVSHELLKSSEDIVISDYEKEYTNIVMDCVNGGVEEGYIDVPLFYYPCYKAVDVETKEALSLDYGENKRIRIKLPPGYQGKIALRVSERKLWRIAEVVSLLSIMSAFYMIIKKRNITDMISVLREAGRHRKMYHGQEA